VTGGEKKLDEIRIFDPSERYGIGEHVASLAREVRAEIDRVVPQERTRLGLHHVLDDWFAHLEETQADGEQHPPVGRMGAPVGAETVHSLGLYSAVA